MNLATSSVRAVGVLSAGLLALGMLAACTPEPEPKPAKTALFSSDEEAFKAAEETYREYTDALNKVDTSDPATFEPVYAFSSGSFLADDKENLSWMHAEKLTIGGATRIVDFTGVKTTGARQTVEAVVCLDVSTVTLVDPKGDSRVNPTRPDNYAISVTFKDNDERLSIDAAEVSEDPSCAG